jgi:hypothetical protein
VIVHNAVRDFLTALTPATQPFLVRRTADRQVLMDGATFPSGDTVTRFRDPDQIAQVGVWRSFQHVIRLARRNDEPVGFEFVPVTTLVEMIQAVLDAIPEHGFDDTGAAVLNGLFEVLQEHIDRQDEIAAAVKAPDQ